ncbi:unnamed protein product [Onchocerca ochengi]|uniref:hydroxyacylglutathione hydrolase n=1 Tax=Onchocerca ochengi TaxID=42157 RepID=A0A182DYQ0_ONCOC|nr:unnamed protein product [Onchocerca ochengi]
MDTLVSFDYETKVGEHKMRTFKPSSRNLMAVSMPSLTCWWNIRQNWRDLWGCAATNYRIIRRFRRASFNSHRRLFMVDVGSKRVNIHFASGVESLDSVPSCSEAFSISSAATFPAGLQKEPMSPISEQYRLKKLHLQQKYDYIYTSNNRLRNRLYHIKKEINHLKRLKRVLCQRLFTFRDPFMDSCLEIPDNDPTSSTAEKISGDAKLSGSSKKKKAAEVKRVNQQVNEVSSMVEIAKNSVISIIDSVITESHEERVRANKNFNGQKTPQHSPSVLAVSEKMQNETGIEGIAEDGEPVIERMLRASSIDHLLPVDPDSDPNNVLTGFDDTVAHAGHCMYLALLLTTIKKISTTAVNRKMKVLPIPALSDNYMYLLIDEKTNNAAIVDPVNLKSISEAVREAGVTLTSSLVTHHHWDHAGATKELSDEYCGLSIYGGDDRIAGVTNKVRDGDVFKIGELDVKCLYTPCHTTGSICYYVTDGSDEKVVFTGDTLFIGGCGRFFEGNATDMDSALNEKLASLPNDTKIYCGHEYTVDNLKFAHSVEPKNNEITKKLAWAEERRKIGSYTVPSTIEEEKRFNPFMRVRISDELRNVTKSADPITVMTKIRCMKNNFRV